MLRTALPCLALALAAPLAAAGTQASTTVRNACTTPAPPGSLRPQPLSPITFAPDANGVVTMEMESQPAIGNWVLETALPGYRASGYYRWNGPDLFNTPGVDTLTFRFRIDQPGDHIIRLRTQHNHPDPTLENDVWFRFDGGTWHKFFNGDVNFWSTVGFLEDTGMQPQYNISAGIHTIELSGRSKNFKIDALEVLPFSVWFWQNVPQSPLARSRPVMGSSFTVNIGDPTNAAGLTPGSTVTMYMGGAGGNPDPNFPCGTPTKFGEVMIALPTLSAGAQQVFHGPGNPGVHTLTIPNEPMLLGRSFSTQGALWDQAAGRIVLTNGLELTIGDQ